MPLRQLELWTPAQPKAVDAASSGDRGVSGVGRSGPSHTASGPAVVPEATGEFDARSQYFLDQSRTDRTRLAYARDCQAFERWCASHGLRSLPASVSTLARYLTELVQGGRKVSTVRRARIAIGMAHADIGVSRPDRDPRIRALERGMGRVFGTREAGATPLLMEHIEKILATLANGARDDRDRALLLLGFAGAFRGSELASLRVEHLAFRADGVDILLERSKEDLLGAGTVVRIDAMHNPALCAVQATRRWLERVGEGTGPVLRRVAGEQVLASAMQSRGISRAIQRLATRAALRGEYSSHSLRAGLATSAYARGLTDREIQAHGRWKDRRSLDRYIDVRAAHGSRKFVSALG